MKLSRQIQLLKIMLLLEGKLVEMFEQSFQQFWKFENKLREILPNIEDSGRLTFTLKLKHLKAVRWIHKKP